MERLGLTADAPISDDGDSFVTMLCRDRTGLRVVLKYVHTASADAYRRLRNETLLLRHLRVRTPLRLLRHKADGPGYLLTDFDAGALLRPDAMDDRVAAVLARALTEFQSTRLNARQIGVVDRERLSTYYVKVLTKNLAHLWPAHINARDACRCLSIVRTALPAICARGVICHGDFLPTNLLYHGEDASVTFTDLESFMSANHPLFDVLALLSISGLDLSNWSWQRTFLTHYLDAAAARLGLDPRSREYQEAYRAILIFFLVYRLSEHRMLLTGGAYFNGVGKRRFITRKTAALVSGRRSAWREEALDEALQVRKLNLQRALSAAQYGEHFEAMYSSAVLCH